MPTPSDLLAAMLRDDPGRPRVTFYEDTPGPTQGERIELSAKVLANWVSKAGNALQEEWDLGPASRVRLALPPHWRSLYWAMAVWSVGATVVLDDGPHDLLVTDDATLLDPQSTPAVLVTLAALARSAPGAVPAGAMDEARELATYADQLSPWDEPAPSAGGSGRGRLGRRLRRPRPAGRLGLRGQGPHGRSDARAGPAHGAGCVVGRRLAGAVARPRAGGWPRASLSGRGSASSVDA